MPMARKGGKLKAPAKRTRTAAPAAAKAKAAVKASAAAKARAPAKAKARAPAGRKAPAAPMLLRAPQPHHHDPHHDLHHEVSQFLYRQSELLDDQRWQDWIDLFTDDGIYWMPADPEDTTWDGVPSIFAEDRNLMTVRMKRVLHPDAWSQKPMWGTSHVLGNVVILPRDPRTGDIVVRSRFHMMELRRDSTRHFAGTYVHHLVRTPNGLKIRLQRTDMVNGQAAYDYVLQVWV
jgi:3-phenylpropionate/cinnamic acid dioxygenase small subunit